MSKNSVSISLANHEKICEELKELNQDAEKAIKSTVSDFKSRAPAWVGAAVTEEYTIKKSEVKAALKGTKKQGTINVAGIQVDSIGLEYKGRLLTPIHFKMNPKKPSAKRGKKKSLIPGENIAGYGGQVAAINPVKKYKIKAEIHKGKQKELHGRYDPSPFLASNGHGSYLPFQRVGTEREKIVSIKSTSVPQMITNEKVSEDIMEKVNEGMLKRLNHHVQRILGS